MATTTAPTPTSTRNSHIGGAVMVSFYDSGHRIHSAFAHVLAEGPQDENGNPSLSVAFPDPDANPQKLASPKWYEAYRRVSGVLHVDNPAVVDGKVSIAWGGTIGSTQDLKGTGPEIPQPEGDASRPYYKRPVLKEAVKESREQKALNETREIAEITPTSAPAENPADETPGGTTSASDAPAPSDPPQAPAA
ncbi:MAG: hypothetical protein KGL39_36360 [Patescibacteria group bacterium]|nr:hypothetical protein [Patescibacteria group bacterium]